MSPESQIPSESEHEIVTNAPKFFALATKDWKLGRQIGD